MPAGIFVLLCCQLAGECARQLFSLPVPGPVIGMFLLSAILIVRDRRTSAREENSATPEVPTPLTQAADSLIGNMGLLFVPAGVGIVAMLPLLHGQWLPMVLGLAGSTVLSLVVTGLVMHGIERVLESRARRRLAAPSPDA